MRCRDMTRKRPGLSAAALGAIMAFVAPAAAAQEVLLDCRAESERFKARLQVVAEEARLEIQAEDGRVHACRATPNFVDGSPAHVPYLRVSMTVVACVPVLPDGLARRLRRDIVFRKDTLKSSSTLLFTSLSSAHDCKATIDRLDDFFAARRRG